MTRPPLLPCVTVVPAPAGRTMNIIRHIALIIAALTIVLAVQSGSAHASTRTIVVDPPLHYHRLFIDPNRASVLAFKSQVFDYIEPRGWGFEVTLERTSDTVTIEPLPGAKPRELTGQLFIITRMYTLILDIQPETKGHPAELALTVNHRSLRELIELAAKTLADERTKQLEEKHAADMQSMATRHQADLDKARSGYESELEKQRTEYETSLRRDEQAALLQGVANGNTSTVLLDDPESCSGGDVAICGLEWMNLGRYGVLRFVVNNTSKADFPARSIHVSPIGEIHSRAGSVQIGDKAPVDSSDFDAVFPRGQRVKAAVIVNDPDTVGSSLRMIVHGNLSALTAIKVIDLRPKPGEGLITLGLQGIYGAVWLANPVEPGQLGATSSTGLALRIRYGFSRRWSFEGELAGTRSGSVEFAGVTVEGQPGDVVREALVARVLVGGVLHFGDRFRPMIRAGLGFQGVSHGSRFTPTGGVDQDGPGAEFEVVGLWMVGLGFEARLTEHWTAGLETRFVGTATSSDGEGRAFEGGLHLSYQWATRTRR